MNYTITFNPAIDYLVEVDDFKEGKLNRSNSEAYIIGGKGINVSLLLAELDVSSCALGFIGGFTGDYLRACLDEKGINNHFIEVAGQTRINVKLKGKKETEINGRGPEITKRHYEELYDYLKRELKSEDTVFLSGNLARGMNKDNYWKIAKLCQELKVNFILDSNRELVTACLTYQPFLIKPNRHELAEIFNVSIQTDSEVLTYAKELQKRGAQNILISMGEDGAILLTSEGKVFRASAAKGKMINSVGAGDSMLAGFMAEYQSSRSLEEALRLGSAAGAATAFSLGIAKRQFIESLKEKINIIEMKEE
ncbi:1-phosphofructokinase [Facklamia miroungae]|uniref:Tagatose-6-phosphate kinase n=1 Tax=Facklamia miroungae TaxID=120956 RepID=A0A1G7UN75_9LACT|nr:1-phosphofructokinase [Facklamia miroungae]NKZ30188.1 1-phosphofructokinase [Facklamia miroungae]SDG49012.1 1-phosphofructokinase [Facklamia miroungae]